MITCVFRPSGDLLAFAVYTLQNATTTSTRGQHDFVFVQCTVSFLVFKHIIGAPKYFSFCS